MKHLAYTEIEATGETALVRLKRLLVLLLQHPMESVILETIEYCEDPILIDNERFLTPHLLHLLTQTSKDKVIEVAAETVFTICTASDSEDITSVISLYLHNLAKLKMLLAPLLRQDRTF